MNADNTGLSQAQARAVVPRASCVSTRIIEQDERNLCSQNLFSSNPAQMATHLSLRVRDFPQRLLDENGELGEMVLVPENGVAVTPLRFQIQRETPARCLLA